MPASFEPPVLVDVDAGVTPPNGTVNRSPSPSSTVQVHTFLPDLVIIDTTQELPVRKELTILFVDIADSTVTVVNKAPEEAFDQVKNFMHIITAVAIDYCGYVKDYEGDGVLLCFKSLTEATQAALAMRETLVRAQANDPQALHARFSLSIGDVVIGLIGTTLKTSVALIGPCINLAARLLKQIPPGGIIATATVVERLRRETPELARQFTLWNERLELKGFQNEMVTAFHIP
ncbi:MAG: adenylate/guanylate cyclase domain-containing protein [Deltaproteobacteria bacterium]|nr:adenylate/guanylate cyclase domain-containing protein [Deltaproteobacteria bacterium]